MTEFLRDLLSRPSVARTVILLEPDSMSAPRQYEVRPGSAVYAAVGAVAAVAAVIVAAIVLTPLRGVLVGPGADELRAEAERNAGRAAALEDSVRAQAEQVDLLRALITGTPADSAGTAAAPPTDAPPPLAAPRSLPAPAPAGRAATRTAAPDNGRAGLDLAVAPNTPVGAAGSGTVVFADRTQRGGLTVAVQQAGGYLFIYSHAGRLLARSGDRVQARQPLALSGPASASAASSLHVEVWREGRLQDPAPFFSTR